MVFQTIYSTRPAFEVALTDYLLEKCSREPELSFPRLVFLAKEFARSYKGIKCKMMLKVKPAANIIGKPEIKPYQLDINVVRSVGRYPFLTFHLSGVDFKSNPCMDMEVHGCQTVLLHLVGSEGNGEVALKFYDSYGDEVTAGDVIIIESHYSFQHLHNRQAEVVWNQTKGMFQYKMLPTQTDKNSHSIDNFYGVHRFKKVPDN